MASKYNDPTAVMQVVGCVFNNPQLLDITDKYSVVDEDFCDSFHKVVFGAIYKLHELGAKKITLQNIADFLSDRPKSEATYKQNKGDEWLTRVSDAAMASTFDYYYSRLKKFSLLRAFDNCGIAVSDIYDMDNILDMKKKQLQEDMLDNSTLEQIANKVDEKIENIRYQYVNDDFGEAQQAATGIKDLIQRFKDAPEVGVPLYGPLVNTVTRGARLKKFYLRSAGTGVGKTRSMIADACYIACAKIYDENFGWIKCGTQEHVLFMLSTRLKDLCNQYGVFIMSATQLNGDWKDAKIPDQNLLRGAKAIADKIDYGSILLNTTDEDLVALENILSSSMFEKPTIKMSIYKNRRGRYKGVILWCKSNLGCCRIQPMFCTTYDYEMVSIDDVRIRVDEESAFEI